MSSCARLVCLFALFYQVNSQCVWEDFEVQADFDAERYTGQWYEISWIPPDWLSEEYYYKDYHHVYEWADDSDKTELRATIRAREGEDDEYCLEYYGTLHVTAVPGKFIYERAANNQSDFRSAYWVMETDYDNYAVVYGCQEADDEGQCEEGEVDTWLWGRRRTLEEEYRTLANSKIEELCLNVDDYVDTLQARECVSEEEDSTMPPTDSATLTSVSTTLFSVLMLLVTLIRH